MSSAIDETTAAQKLHDVARALNVLAPAIDSALDYLNIQSEEDDLPKAETIAAALLTLTKDLIQGSVRYLDDLHLKNPAGPEPEIALLTRLQMEIDALLSVANRSRGFLPALLRPSLKAMGVTIRLIRSTTGLHPNRERTKLVLRQIDKLERQIVIFHLSSALQGIQHVRNSIQPRPSAQLKVGKAELCDLIHIVRNVMNSAQPRADLKKVVFRPRLMPGPAMVEMDEGLLHRCISNIIDNAIKYTQPLPPGSRHAAPWIDVIATPASDTSVEIVVKSWGVPVTPEEYEGELMFAEGYRGYHAFALDIEGSGAGLSDAKRFIEDHGGSVTFKSDPVVKSSRPPRSVETILTLTFPARRAKLGGPK